MSDSEDEVQSRTIKITVIGEPQTGKSSLCWRYLGEGGGAQGGTQGAEVLAGQCAGLRPPVPLQLCDVAGNALGTSMLDNYLYASDVVLFVYDVTKLQSFEKLHIWFAAVKDVFEPEIKKPLMALFGNKTDLEHQRVVRLSVVQQFASEHLLENYKGSARTGEMVNTTFTTLVARVLGTKVQRLPVLTNGKSPAPRIPEHPNDQVRLPQQVEPTQSLIMHRKMLRKIQRKESSSVCFIEKYTDNVRFCIICNYLGKIIPALQSRCTRFRFAPLQQSQIVPRLDEIAQAEGVKITDDGRRALITLSGGDMRKVLNTLQSTWLAYRDVTEDNVYTCVGHPLRSDITSIVNWLLNEGDFASCFKNIQDLKIAKGLALGDILTEVHTVIQRSKFYLRVYNLTEGQRPYLKSYHPDSRKYSDNVKLPPEVLISLLIKMSDAEARLATGCSERVELAALIAAFHLARDQVKLTFDA